MKVKCIKRYSDICLKEIVEKGTVLEVTENRGAHLIIDFYFIVCSSCVGGQPLTIL